MNSKFVPKVELVSVIKLDKNLESSFDNDTTNYNKNNSIVVNKRVLGIKINVAQLPRICSFVLTVLTVDFDFACDSSFFTFESKNEDNFKEDIRMTLVRVESSVLVKGVLQCY